MNNVFTENVKIVEIRNLCKSYGDHKVLDGFDLDLP